MLVKKVKGVSKPVIKKLALYNYRGVEYIDVEFMKILTVGLNICKDAINIFLSASFNSQVQLVSISDTIYFELTHPGGIKIPCYKIFSSRHGTLQMGEDEEKSRYRALYLELKCTILLY